MLKSSRKDRQIDRPKERERERERETELEKNRFPPLTVRTFFDVEEDEEGLFDTEPKAAVGFRFEFRLGSGQLRFTRCTSEDKSTVPSLYSRGLRLNLGLEIFVLV